MNEFAKESFQAINYPVDSEAFKSLLDDLGLTNVADTSLTCERDMTVLLKPIQARKLLAFWSVKRNLLDRFVVLANCLLLNPLVLALFTNI